MSVAIAVSPESTASRVMGFLEGEIPAIPHQRGQAFFEIAIRIRIFLETNKEWLLNEATPNECSFIAPLLAKVTRTMALTAWAKCAQDLVDCSMAGDRADASAPNASIVIVQTETEFRARKKAAALYLITPTIDERFHEQDILAEAGQMKESLGAAYHQIRAVYFGPESEIKKCLDLGNEIFQPIEAKVPSRLICVIL